MDAIFDPSVLLGILNTSGVAGLALFFDGIFKQQQKEINETKMMLQVTVNKLAQVSAKVKRLEVNSNIQDYIEYQDKINHTFAQVLGDSLEVEIDLDEYNKTKTIESSVPTRTVERGKERQAEFRHMEVVS